jgi:hypothetical protein
MPCLLKSYENEYSLVVLKDFSKKFKLMLFSYENVMFSQACSMKIEGNCILCYCAYAPKYVSGRNCTGTTLAGVSHLPRILSLVKVKLHKFDQIFRKNCQHL